MRPLFVPSSVSMAMVCVLSWVAPVVATPLEPQQTFPDTVAAGANPFDNPDDDFDKFPVPEELPPSAGTFTVPKPGPWDANNFPGEMVCTGIVNLNLPLEPARDSGTLEIRNGGQTIFGDGLSDDTEDITMQSVPGLIGRYSGIVAGSPGGVPMSIDYYWQVVTDEWIIGYLTSHVDAQGMTCDMFRTYELRYTGDSDQGDREVAGQRVQLCHRPPGNPENTQTITVGAAAVAAHLDHGDSLGPCP